MGIFDWVRAWFGIKEGSKEIKLNSTEKQELYSAMAEIQIRELALWTAINLIANSISKCEFKTFYKHEEVKGKEYYLFNVSPNINQSSSQFLKKLISTLLLKNECLVIEENENLLVADSYDTNEYALYENEFTNVKVGDLEFKKTFFMSKVLFFKLSEKNMNSVIAGLYESYGKLISYSMKSYQKSRGNRGTLQISSVAQGKPDFKEKVEDMLNNRFKTFFNADNAVLPVYEGYKYDELASKTYSSEGTRDIRAMIEDIFDFTAKGLTIPPALLRGDVQGTNDAVDNLLTFCIDPLVDMLQEEINRKRNGYENYVNGTYLSIDTKAIKHVDLLSVSTAIDKLISSGAFTINDIRKLVGETEVKEEWANKHFITKNYSPVENILDIAGGENI